MNTLLGLLAAQVSTWLQEMYRYIDHITLTAALLFGVVYKEQSSFQLRVNELIRKIMYMYVWSVSL